MTQNNVVITGRIAFEPKIYATKKDGKIANIVLGVYDGKDQNNNARYYDIAVKTFDTKIADSLENLGKGADIIVVGKLANDKYEKDGKTIVTTYVLANYVGVNA